MDLAQGQVVSGVMVSVGLVRGHFGLRQSRVSVPRFELYTCLHYLLKVLLMI